MNKTIPPDPPTSFDRLPEKVALVCDGRRLTYADVESRANRLARALRDRGLRRGDRAWWWSTVSSRSRCTLPTRPRIRAPSLLPIATAGSASGAASRASRNGPPERPERFAPP